MDIGDTIAPKSDQLDSVDLITGPRTFTIERITAGNADQPFNLHLKEFDRPYRPGLSMRRVLVSCWGGKSAEYVGRSLTLYCDPTIKFGGIEVGGIRISHMSHLNGKARKVPLIVTRGKSIAFEVKPLAEGSPKKTEVPLTQRIEAAVKSFGHGGVALDQLEQRIGRVRGEWTADDLADLTAIFQALKNGEVSKDEAFPQTPQPEDPPADLPPEEDDPTLDPNWGQQ
jgi:hypothetical protein